MKNFPSGAAMYESFFGLQENPFSNTPDPQFFFFSRQHEEALALLAYGINGKKGFMAFTGEIGTGKTTLCRSLMGRLDSKVRTALILNPALSTVELLRAINEDFELPSWSSSRKVLVDALNAFLLEVSSEGGNAALIIDEAQNLVPDALEQVRLLSNLETETEKLIQIVLVGQPELRDKLALPELAQLNQRIAIRYHLTPLDHNETVAYIQHRLQVALSLSATPSKTLSAEGEEPFFTSKALDRICEATRGVPRLVNMLCDRSLLAAFVRETRTVSDAMVARALQELDWQPMGDRPRPLERSRGKAPLVASWFGFAHHRRRWRTALAGLAVGLLVASVAWVWLVGAGNINAGPASQVNTPPVPVKVDAQGIVRVAHRSEAALGATLNLLRLWGMDVVDLESLPQAGVDWDADAVGRRFGFEVLRFPKELDRLVRLGYPCVLELRQDPGQPPYPVVLARMDEREAVVLDALNGRQVISLQELEARWEGDGFLWWGGIEGLVLPLRPGQRNASVMRLQELLQAVGTFSESSNGVYGDSTVKAIRRFQHQEGLPATGIVDTDILVVLSRRVGGLRTPGLMVP